MPLVTQMDVTVLRYYWTLASSRLTFYVLWFSLEMALYKFLITLFKETNTTVLEDMQRRIIT